LELRSGTNITIDSSGIISSSGGSGGTSYDDANRLDYNFLSEPISTEEVITNYSEPIALLQSPIVSPITNYVNIDSAYRYLIFNHNNNIYPQTDFTITFSEDTECDILVIGGGGGGGKRHGAGGGAGTLLYHKGQILNGLYNIKVGKGGVGAVNSNANSATVGNFSEFKKDDGTKRYYANGGGFGTSSGTQQATTNGGQGYLNNTSLTLPTNNIFNDVTVTVVSKQYQNSLTLPEGCRGFVGGGQVENFKGGGGGGAGSLGQNHGLESSPNDGYGGDGLGIDITGVNVLYAGGGNGSDFNGSISQVRDPNKPSISSRGGGGYGSDNGSADAGNNGTGAGGGGQGNDTASNNAGSGGSGVVIIRYKINVPFVINGTIINDSYEYLTFLNTSGDATKYTVELPQEIEIQILLLNNLNYREIDVPFDISFGTFELIVGKNGINTTFAQVSSGVNGSSINSGRVSNITGTNVNYNSPIAIIKYRNKKTEKVQIEVDGLLKYTKDNGWLIDTAISDTIISNTSLIAILQSQMIQVFATLAAKSINAVYEWATDNQEWKIVEVNKQIFLPNGNFQIRLRVINDFANNAI